jgi:hypothetical protein
MREDVYIEEVISKCEAFKKANIWPTEQILKPRTWLNNFDNNSDKYIAAVLLNHFIFYNEQLTNRLLKSSFESICDGYPKGPNSLSPNILLDALKNAVYTLVEGERPNVTDSGYIMCRKARQLLNIPETFIVNISDAQSHASRGGTVVFVDDFIGSGDQFMTTWEKSVDNISFKNLQLSTNFVAIYVALVSTHTGLNRIRSEAPSVAVCLTHVLNEDVTFRTIGVGTPLQNSIVEFLKKYSNSLTPREDYMARNSAWKAFGYKEKGLLLGFSHSIPDATLPIFWSPGIGNWEPLIERS